MQSRFKNYKNKHIIIIAGYEHFDSKIKCMEELINKINLTKYHLVLAGDFNTDLLEYSHNNKCKGL